MIVYLRGVENDKTLSDDFLLKDYYEAEHYYWTEWNVEDEDEYYDEKGVLHSVDE